MIQLKTYLTMDVGGTNVLAGLVDSEGRVLARRHFATRAGRPVEQLIADMAANLSALRTEAPNGRAPAALAIGLPGWISQSEGVLINAPNMPGWSNVPLASILSRELGLPVYLENDTNMYALGEWLYGAGRGLKNLIVITLGTGVGGGLILDKQLWNGSFASAVEVGHIPLTARGGALCGCGRRGCLETVASATGMKRLAREWIEAGKPTLYKGRPDDINTKIMAELANQGDPMSRHVFQRAGEALGMILVGIFNLLGLEGVVIGGGAAGAFEHISPKLWRTLSCRLIVAEPSKISVIKCALGEDAPLAGGAALLKRLGL